MAYITEEGLSFDDVLLVPKYSEVMSRANVDVSVSLTKGIKINFPVVPSNMKTITGIKMAEAIYNLKGMAILHRFMTIDEQKHTINELIEKYSKDVLNYVGVSVGVKSSDFNNVKDFVENLGVKIICVDVAHGDSKFCVDMTKFVSKNYPDILLISGNIATYDGALRLYEAGADIVKSNVGSGSICTTRIETGNGVPALTSLIEASKAKSKYIIDTGKKVFLMCDGGCKSVGDLVKALAFADLCMAGNMFAGAEETPGNVLNIDGKKYKEYVGSSTHRGNRTEGVAAIVPIKDDVKSITTRMIEGIQSGCSYQGAFNLKELRENATFIKMTSSGLRESHAHDVIVQK